MIHLAPRLAVLRGFALFSVGLVFGPLQAWTQTLIERSPFLPPDFNQPSAAPPASLEVPVSAQHLRFKGVFSLNGTVKVNLFNTQTNQGNWVTLNEEIDGFRVVSYDVEDRAVDLEVDGKITRFALATPTDAPLVVATAPRTSTATRPATRAATTSTVRRRAIVPPRPSSRAPGNNTGTRRRPVVPARQSPR